jgi:hypothetical protein
MSLSYEKRHLPLPRTWFHRRTTGGGEPFVPVEDFLLLEDDDGSGTSFLLLESDPGTGTDGLLLETSNV